MSKINFSNKIPAVGNDPAAWTTEMKVSASDMNEIKASVNSLYDSKRGKMRQLISRIYQSGTANPTIDNSNRYYDDLANISDTESPMWGIVTLARTGVGAYKISLFTYQATNAIPVSKVDLTFGDKIMRRGLVTFENLEGGIQETIVPFYSYDMSGVLADGVISDPSTTITFTVYA